MDITGTALPPDYPSAVFVWGKWLPYHFARVQACVGPFREAGLRVLAVQYSDISIDYKIASTTGVEELEFFDLGLGDHEADFRPLRIVRHWPAFIRRHQCRIVFVPSYGNWAFSITLLSRLLGCKVVMMNESHAGTQRATGWKKWIKRQMVRQFDAALVGGEPHKRHFASLGIPADKIFTGYDAVDNDFFASRADEIRAEAKKSVQCSVFSVQQKEKAEVRTLSSQRSQSRGSKEQDRPEAEHLSTLNSQPSTKQSIRSAYGLPERYFLSLGRMVEKKNLATLVSAYARYAEGVAVAGEKLKVKGNDWEKQGDTSGGVASPPQAEGSEVVTSHQVARCSDLSPQTPVLATRYALPALVLVGSGELEGALKEQARSLGLRVVDRTDAGPKTKRLKDEETKAPQSQAEDCKPNTENSVESDRGAVYFYGFRQIEENPVFYALAEAFVLPSLKEEWGLVVNEAMAAGLPVIVSRTAGCAEDLVPQAPASGSVEHGAWSMESGEDAGSLNVAYGPSPAIRPTVQRSTLNSLEERSNGFIFDPSSVDALATALARVADPFNVAYGQSPAIRPTVQRSTLNAAAMGRRSREIVEQFNCDNFARQALRAAEAAAAESQEA